jgi:hypothetical protein
MRLQPSRRPNIIMLSLEILLIALIAVGIVWLILM